MASIPGLPADVYFGNPDKPLPNWREHAENDDEDSPPSDDDLRYLRSALGFDHKELWDDSDTGQESPVNHNDSTLYSELEKLLGR